MKRVVINNNEPTISLASVTGDNIYVYMTGTGRLFLLSRLGRKHVPDKRGEYHHGFVPLSTTNEVPVFLGDSMRESITKAAASGNNIMEFENLTALMKWKLKISS